MVTTNILQRTFHIAHKDACGTAFTIEVSDRQYLVTAAHVVKDLQSNSSISVMHRGQWVSIQIDDVWLSPTGADLALISIKKQISPVHPIIVGKESFYYLSQQIYFLGFPYGMRLEVGSANNDYPAPFIKTGIISSFTLAGTGSQIVYCDGHNNPGFSGGPIFTVGKDHQVHVIAVVSGYRHNNDPIMLNGENTGLTYQANTGLIIGYGLNELVEHATKNVSGAEITVRA
jgi:hypothetical protein